MHLMIKVLVSLNTFPRYFLLRIIRNFLLYMLLFILHGIPAVLHHIRFDKRLIFFSLFFSPLSTNLNFKPLYKVGKPPTKAWFMQMPSDPFQEPAILSLWTTTQEKNFILHHYSWNLLFSIHMLIFSPVIITFRLDKV